MRTQRESIAIIGGGIIGMSILYHLAERHGRTDVALFERGQLGSGTTSKSNGGIRNIFLDEQNRKMGQHGIDFYGSFDERVGGNAEFQQDGYLYLYHTAEGGRQWRERNEVFRDNGLQTELLDPAEISDIFPPIERSTIRGGLFGPDCGVVDPHGVVQGFKTVATKRGATIHTNTEVTDITVTSSGVESLATDAGTVDVDCVINAAGPWANRIARHPSLVKRETV